jgi:hypothetical protein
VRGSLLDPDLGRTPVESVELSCNQPSSRPEVSVKVRTALPVALSAVMVAGAFAPALAAPKPKPKPRPITASYTVQGKPVPIPLVGFGPSAAVEGSDSCTDARLEGVSMTTRTIKTVGAGTLVVDVTKFAGDWDITVTDGAGEILGIGEGTTTGGEVPVAGGGNGSIGLDNHEHVDVKLKKASTLNIAVCNYLGGPSANVKYTYTYK